MFPAHNRVVAGSTPASGLFDSDRSVFRAVFLLYEFRKVVAVGAQRLTDKQKKKIIADYVQLQNYTKTAKLNDVAESTVRKIVKNNPDCANQCEHIKRILIAIWVGKNSQIELLKS